MSWSGKCSLVLSERCFHLDWSVMHDSYPMRTAKGASFADTGSSRRLVSSIGVVL